MDDEEGHNHLESALAKLRDNSRPILPAQYLFITSLVGVFELAAVVCVWFFVSWPALDWVFTNWPDAPYVLDYVIAAALFWLPVFLFVKMHAWLRREFDFL